jgi:hypothetical protein
MRSKVIAAGLAAACVGLCPAAAVAKTATDYSKNSATGEYVAPAVRAGSHIDYSRNAATGEFAPSSPAPSDAAVAKPDDGGPWIGPALVGSALTLVLVGAFAGLRRTRRRATPAPVAAPKLVSR